MVVLGWILKKSTMTVSEHTYHYCQSSCVFSLCVWQIPAYEYKSAFCINSVYRSALRTHTWTSSAYRMLYNCKLIRRSKHWKLFIGQMWIYSSYLTWSYSFCPVLRDFQTLMWLSKWWWMCLKCVSCWQKIDCSLSLTLIYSY